MVRAPCIDQNGMKKGAWSEEEDNKLRVYVQRYGHWNWRQLPKFAGLKRCGKSCRLRWMNYLMPGVRRGNYTPEEEDLIIELHRKFGSKWSVIAAHLPGRVDNDIKNHWHSHLRRKMKLLKPFCSKSTDDDHSSTPMNEADPDYNQESDSCSVSAVLHSKMRKDQDQIENDSNNNEVSSLSCDGAVLLQDSAADSPSSASMESFWTQPFATSPSTDHHFHLQLPAFLEEEIMRPFTSDLDEINMDFWLHELMQVHDE